MLLPKLVELDISYCMKISGPGMHNHKWSSMRKLRIDYCKRPKDEYSRKYSPERRCLYFFQWNGAHLFLILGFTGWWNGALQSHVWILPIWSPDWERPSLLFHGKHWYKEPELIILYKDNQSHWYADAFSKPSGSETWLLLELIRLLDHFASRENNWN